MQMLFWTTSINHTFSDNLQFLPQVFFANVLLFCPFFVFQKQVLTYVEVACLKIKKAAAVETYFSWTNSETVLAVRVSAGSKMLLQNSVLVQFIVFKHLLNIPKLLRELVLTLARYFSTSRF